MTSLAKNRGFNQVERFFADLQTVMDKYKFSKSLIWNVDETGGYLFLNPDWPTCLLTSASFLLVDTEKRKKEKGKERL